MADLPFSKLSSVPHCLCTTVLMLNEELRGKMMHHVRITDYLDGNNWNVHTLNTQLGFILVENYKEGD